MTRETGKILPESRAEVIRAVDILRFIAQSHWVITDAPGHYRSSAGVPGRSECRLALSR